MKAHSIKTDNANVSHKVELRQKGTANLSEIKVLDLFAGNNILWSYFNCKKYYGIEKEKDKGRNLTADNLRVIQSLDLSNFNVVDCDSYGMPVKQIIGLYKNITLKKGTVIFYTAIGNAMSSLPSPLVKKNNLTNLYKKCKVLFNKKSHDMFYGMLYDFGIKTVFEYEENASSFNKKYGYFVV